ncbi:FMN-binding glutamate synthase family protein [Salicibibacter cibi]|uniref:FMN-binding glutamate synthase family protein n=1 Tax=Salicibibacter cibi TaxID=2743001 RepID=A0A7T7CEM3_9BACI|nr:FMN-binding glutamate synthase family protein [Salicibibacter cibi]QQK79202.1 FMN-binding glutamate synthase family protein [Salicibibacter cibi]
MIGIDWTLLLIKTLVIVSLSLILSVLYIIIFPRPIIKWMFAGMMKRFMSKKYEDNLWELISAMTRISPNTIMENSLRSASGTVISRPFGSPRDFHHFDGLVFSPAQLAKPPADASDPIELTTTIGPHAKRPLVLDIPLMAGGMGYGNALSKKVKKAIARATSATGTATNSGEGAYLPEERELAEHFILQYAPGNWSKSPEILGQADAIEIHIGQGARAAATYCIPPEDLPGEIRETFQLSPGETLVVPPLDEPKKSDGLKKLVDRLRRETNGIPIGVKIVAGAELEADMKIAIQATVDFISIDGGQAGTKGDAPVFEDDFGLPTIYALARAAKYLKKKGVKHKISLLVGGGLTTPGECLKAMALGADAVYMGTAFIWAMSHDQVTKSLPWDPPTSLIFYAKKKEKKFNEEKAAYHLENFIISCSKEMEEAARALGKSSIHDITGEDLVALDELTSDITNVKLGYDRPE